MSGHALQEVGRATNRAAALAAHAERIAHASAGAGGSGSSGAAASDSLAAAADAKMNALAAGAEGYLKVGLVCLPSSNSLFALLSNSLFALN